MYIFAVCDDNLVIEINGALINKTLKEWNCYNSPSGFSTCWNIFGYFYVENVSQNDKVTIKCYNGCGPGGMNVSYIWNKCLYTLPNNGMEGIANIINYQVTGNTGWSTLWSSYVQNLLPWMKNYITMQSTGCGSSTPTTTMQVSFNIGNTVKIPFTKNLWCYTGIDDNGIVYLNGSTVYISSQPWYIMGQFTVPNVNYGDTLLVDCQNQGGPGGVSLTYIYQGIISTLPSSLQGFNSVANNLVYTSYGLVNGIYPAQTNNNLMFNVNGKNMNWLNSCNGNCNYGISTNIVGSISPNPPLLPGLNDINFAETNESFSNMITYDEEKYVKYIYILIIVIIILLIYFFVSKLKIKKLKK